MKYSEMTTRYQWSELHNNVDQAAKIVDKPTSKATHKRLCEFYRHMHNGMPVSSAFIEVFPEYWSSFDSRHWRLGKKS